MNDLVLILGVAIILIVIVLLVITLRDILKIARYCLKTNTISEYWNLFFSSSSGRSIVSSVNNGNHWQPFDNNTANGRTIISSIIGFIIALLIFLIIAPIILIKNINNKTYDTPNNI